MLKNKPSSCSIPLLGELCLWLEPQRCWSKQGDRAAGRHEHPSLLPGCIRWNPDPMYDPCAPSCARSPSLAGLGPAVGSGPLGLQPWCQVPGQQLEPMAVPPQRLLPGKVSLQMRGVCAQSPCAQKVFGIRRNTLRTINKQWPSLETAAVKWPRVTIAPLIVHIAFSLQLPATFRSL